MYVCMCVCMYVCEYSIFYTHAIIVKKAIPELLTKISSDNDQEVRCSLLVFHHMGILDENITVITILCYIHNFSINVYDPSNKVLIQRFVLTGKMKSKH